MNKIRIKPDISWVALVLHTLVFLILYEVSMVYAKDIYFFEWSARNSYCYLWIIVWICDIFGKKYIGSLLTLGNLIGIFWGQIHGDWIRANNILKITSDMSPGVQARHYHHPAFEIWLGCILIILVGGIAIRKIITCIKGTNRIS